MSVRMLIWVARIAGLGAMLLGWLSWVFQLDIANVHIVFGSAFALALVALSVALVGRRPLRRLGLAGLGCALAVTALGLLQAQPLAGSLHWLIQLAHLLSGLGAVALVQLMSARYSRLEGARGGAVPPAGAVREIRYH